MRTSKLSVGLITTLLTLTGLAAISLPSAAQEPSPEECIPSGFPPLSPECQAFLDTLVPVPCTQPEIGIEPDCTDPSPEECTDPETGVGEPVCADPGAVGPPAACAAGESEDFPFVTGPDQEACQAALLAIVSGAICPVVNAGGVATTVPDCILEAIGLDETVCENVGEGSTAQACIFSELVAALPEPCQGADAAGLIAAVQTTECQAALTAPVTDVVNTIVNTILSATNTPPTADAGSDQSVNEGAAVQLDGSGSADEDGDTLTYDWSCPGLTLDDATIVAPSFTAPAVSADQDFVCTLTVNDGIEESASDDVTISVADVPLDIVIAINSLASQNESSVISFTGTATANQDVSAAIAIAVSGTPGGAPCDGNTPNVVWSADVSFSRALTAATPEAFDAYVCWDTDEVVTFDVSVSVVGAGSFAESITIDFTGAGSDIEIIVSDVEAFLASGDFTPSSYLPNGTSGVNRVSVLTVTDGNGNGANAAAQGTATNGRIADSRLTASIANGDDSMTVPLANIANVDVDKRTYDATAALPANLKDGTYTLTATYDNFVGPQPNPSVMENLTVTNAAPTITVSAGTFAGVARAAGSDSVSITLKDANIGTLSGAAVTELTAFNVFIHGDDGCTTTEPGAGITFAFAGLASGASAAGATVNYASAALSGGATGLDLTVNWASTTLGNTYYICGEVSDGQATSAKVVLAELALTAINEGFHVTIDDGGNGIDVVGEVGPNSPAQTEALRVLLSGTDNATALNFTVDKFVSGEGDEFEAANLQAKLCLVATLSACTGGNLLGQVAAVAGTEPGKQVLVFDNAVLGAELEAGKPVFVFFSFTVPNGSAAGAYSAPVTVDAEPVPAPLP